MLSLEAMAQVGSHLFLIVGICHKVALHFFISPMLHFLSGLSQILFAKRGGTVLERIVDGGDSGIYAELPFLLGLKYFPMLETAIDAARWRAASASVYRDMILFADSY